ncbi:MAG: cobalamin B12-binding domain-containing protein [Denitromonas halophila]|nr:MAG: cobalamin B12-binding domain-containing protein [Denitromonas halophila]TVT72969.1 MAG: cobalamin B12-binding domain-containing protein [Denitromonas halophila]
MSATFAPLDPEQLTAFSALRDAAIAHSLAASEAAHPAVFARFGPRGRAACAEDIAYHLDFLEPALESGQADAFLSYLAWLAEVLRSRGVPTGSLPDSLRHLDAFYRGALPTAAADTLSHVLNAGVIHLASGAPPPAYDRPGPDPWDEADAFRDAILKGERRGAQRLFESALDRSSTLIGSEVHVIQPAMYAIGRAWQENRASVAQEHLATAISQSLMAAAFGQVLPADDNGGRALFACTPGNHHDVGLRMVCDAFEMDGWQAQFLGGNTPLPALLSQCSEFAPHVLCLSASLPQHLRALRTTLATLRQHLGDACPKVIVGGLVFNQFPSLADTLDAQWLGPTAEDAALAARALLPH